MPAEEPRLRLVAFLAGGGLVILAGTAEIVHQHLRPSSGSDLYYSIVAHQPDHLSLPLALSFDPESFSSGLFLSLPVTSPTSVTTFLV